MCDEDAQRWPGAYQSFTEVVAFACRQASWSPTRPASTGLLKTAARWHPRQAVTSSWSVGRTSVDASGEMASSAGKTAVIVEENGDCRAARLEEEPAHAGSPRERAVRPRSGRSGAGARCRHRDGTISSRPRSPAVSCASSMHPVRSQVLRRWTTLAACLRGPIARVLLDVAARCQLHPGARDQAAGAEGRGVRQEQRRRPNDRRAGREAYRRFHVARYPTRRRWPRRARRGRPRGALRRGRPW